MTCHEMDGFLADYLDGDLPSGVRAEFERHLVICPECVDYLNTYRETIRRARAAFVDREGSSRKVPEELAQAILAARKRGL